jgi:fibronectin-binding autotransporter adhesin
MKYPNSVSLSAVVLTLACALATAPAQAASLYWDTVSGPGLTGGTGFWNGSNWATSSTGGTPNTFSSGANIFFQDTLGSLTYIASNTTSATENIGSITVDDGNNVTLDNTGAGGLTTMNVGGPVTVQGASTLIINMKNWGTGGAPNTIIQAGSALDFTYSNNITQSRPLGLGAISFGSGGGTMAVINNSTATTQFTLTAGDLTGDSTDVINLGSNASHPPSLTFTTTDSLSSFAGQIAGAGILVKAGTGLMTLSGVNTYSSSTAISGGTLVLGGAGVLGGGNYGNPISIATNSALVVNTSSNQTFGGVISGLGGLYQTGSGLLTLANSAANSYTGATTIGGGTLQIGNGHANGSLAAASVINNNSALAFARSDSVSFTNAISGSGAVYQIGSGSLTLSGSDTYGGITYVNSGSLFLNGPNATSAINVAGGTTLSGSGSALSALVTVANGGTVKPGYNGAGGLAFSGLTFNNSGTINVANFGNYATVPAIAVTSLATSGGAGAVAISISGAAPLNINSNLHLLAYSGAIQGTGSSGFSLNTAGITGLPARGATFTLTGTDSGYLDVYYGADNDVWTGAADGTSWNAAAVNWKLASSGSAIAFQNNDPVVFNDSAGNNTAVTIASNVSPFSVIFKSNTSSYTLQGASGITGPAGLFLNGSGSLTIANSNSYTGGTTLNAGLLSIANSAALGSTASTFTITGGTIIASGGPVTLANYPMSWSGGFAFAGSNPLNLGAGTVTLGSSCTLNLSGSVLTVGGVISGAGYGLAESGSGTLLLNAANTFSGNTLVSGGTLLLGNGSALQNSTVDTSGAGLVSFGSQTSATFGGLVNGGSLVLTNTAAQAVSLSVGNNGLNTSYSGAISGSGSLTKVGAGTLYLSGSNSYAGTTSLTAGTLQFQGGGSLPGASPISLGSANLQIHNDGSGSGGTISVGNNITLSLQTTTDTINVGNLLSSNTGNTVAFGVLSNGASSTAFNSTFNFTGANGYVQSFSGLMLSGGGGQGTLLNPTTTSVIIAGNVTNQENGNSGGNWDTLTLSGSSRGNLVTGTISDAADYLAVSNGDTRITMAGTGQWILAGSNTNHGPTTISSGTLQLGTGASGQDGSINNTQSVTNSGVLLYNLFGSQSAPYVISGGGTLTKNGAGTLTLTAADNYSGPTNVLAGTLALGAGGSINSSATISLASGATFDVTAQGSSYALLGTQTLIGIGTTSVAGTMAANSGATILPGGVASAGTMNVGALTLNTGSILKYDLTGSGSLDLINVSAGNGLNLAGPNVEIGLYASNGTAQFNTPGNYTIMTFSGSLSGSPGNLSVLNPNAADTYVFSTSGNGLLLAIVNANSWNGGGGPGAFNWSNSANWSLGQAPTNGQPVTFAGSVGLSNTNDIANLSAAGLVFSPSAGGFNLSGGSIALSGAIVNSSSAVQTIGLNIGLAGGNQTINAAAGNIYIGGVISDGGAGLGIVTAGSHTVYLASANTFSGPTSVSAGTLNLSNGLALQNSTLTGGRVVFDQSVVSHAFTLGGLSGGSNIALVDNGGNPVVLSVGNNGASTSYSGLLSGGGSLAVIGGATLTLGGANTFTGTTFVAGGLVLANSAALQNSTFDTSSPGGLSFGSQTTVVLGGLINGGSIVLANTASQPITLAVGNNGVTSSYSGAMSGNGGTLAMVGNGTFYLSGSNNYTGPTAILAGTMQFQGNNALPGGSLIGLGNGTLQIRNDGVGSGGTINVGNNITLVTNTNAALIDVGNNGSGNTGNTVAFGVLSNGTTANAFASNVYFTGRNGYLQSYSGLNLSGLGGHNTVLVPLTTSVTIAGNVVNQETVNSGTNYDTLTLDGVTQGNSITGVISDASDFTGVGAGDTRVVKSSTSQWILSGSNTYSGPTTITGGTLVIGGAGVLGGGNYSNTIANSGTFVMSTASNQTLGGVISGGGAFYQQGSGATTLTASNTYSGPTFITGGTLALGANAGISQSPVVTLGNGAMLDVSAQGANFHLLSGQTLIGTGNYSVNGAMTANSGSIILPGGAASSGTLNVGALTLSTGSVLNYNLGSGQNLIIVTSSNGLTLNGGGFNLYSGDGMTTFGTPGAYPLIDYAGALSGLAGNLSILNPSPYDTYGFAANGGVLSVNIVANNTWTAGGSPSINWSSSANWSTSQAPTSGNAIVFAGALGLTNSNDIIGLNLTGMIFSNSAGAFNLSGNSIQLSGPIANYSTAAQTIGMNIGLAGGNQTLNAAAGTIAVNGVISDGGAGLGINTTGSGAVVLGAANTYTGPTNVLAGTLSLAHSLAVQYSTVSLTPSGALTFASGVTTPTLGGLSGSGNISLATVVSEPVALNVGGNGQSTTFAGILGGPGGLVKQGAGVLTFTATQGYGGPTRIAGGTLQLISPSIATGSIGIQFVGSGNMITGSDGAYPMNHWNILPGAAPSGANLINSASAITTASVATSSGNSGTAPSGSSDPLLSGYIYKQAGTITVTLSGIPYANYSLYAYSADESTGHTNTLTLGGASYYFTAESDSTFDQITNTNSSLNPLGNYAVATGLSGATQTVTISSAQYTGFCGFEIVNTGISNILPAATPVTISNGATLDMTNIQQTVASLSSTDGMGSQVLLGNGALTIAGTASTTFDGVISGTGGSLILQSGGLMLTGTNAYGGGTTVSGGRLQLNASAGPALGSNLTVSGGSVQLLQSNQIVSSGSVSISAGLLDIGGFSNTLGGLQITGGTIAGTTGVLTSNTVYDAEKGVVSAILGGGAGLNKTTTGTVVLAGANTYNGTTTITAGTLALAHPLAVQNSTVNIVSGGLGFAAGNTGPALGGLSGGGNVALATAASEAVALNVGGDGQSTTYSGVLNGLGSLVKQGNGTLTLSSTQSYGGPTLINGGVLQLVPPVQASGGSLGIGIHFTGNGSAQSGSAGVVSIGNWNNFKTPVNPSNQALVDSTGAATSAAFTAAGATNNNGASHSSVQILNGFNYTNVTGGSMSVTITGIPYPIYNIFAYVVDTTAGAEDEKMTVGGATYYYTPDAGQTLNPVTSTYYNQITNTTPGTYQEGNYIEVSGLSGASQTLTAAGAQLNSGGTEYGSFASIEIVQALPAAAPTNLLPATTPVTISNGATLDMTNIAQTVASLSSTDGMGSQVLMGSGALTITGPAITTFDGVISGGSGALNLQGGMLTLTGVNTYSGSTGINGGTLQLGTGASGQDGSIANTSGVTNNAALLFNLFGSQTANYAITGSGSVTKSGPGTLTLNAANSYSGPTNINSGLLVIAPNSGALPYGSLQVSAGSLDLEGNSPTLLNLYGAGTIGNGASGLSNLAVLYVEGGGNFFGKIQDGGFGGNAPIGLELDGGTLVLSGTNGFSGGTLVDGGTLVLNTGSALENGSSLIVGDNTASLFAPASAMPAAAVAVPEPGTLALLCAAGIAAASLAARKKARNRARGDYCVKNLAGRIGDRW